MSGYMWEMIQDSTIVTWHFRWPWVTFEGHFGVLLTLVTLYPQLTRSLLAIDKFLVLSTLCICRTSFVGGSSFACSSLLSICSWNWSNLVKTYISDNSCPCISTTCRQCAWLGELLSTCISIATASAVSWHRLQPTRLLLWTPSAPARHVERPDPCTDVGITFVADRTTCN